MTLFIDGAIAILSAVVALLFLRFWRRSQDRLFLLFSIAFWILAVDRVFLSAMVHCGAPGYSIEHQAMFYLARLTAFLLMLGAIADKNRRIDQPMSQRAEPSTRQ